MKRWTRQNHTGLWARGAALKAALMVAFLAWIAGASWAVVPAARVGDVDGDGSVTIRDVQLALGDAMGLQKLPADQRAVAALTEAKPSISTARALLRAALGVGALPWACGYNAAEGPAYLSGGPLVFVDGAGSVQQITLDGVRGIYVHTGGVPNGTRLRPDGHLLVADQTGRILDVAPDRSITDLAKTVPGRSICCPNDIALGPAGRIYFSGSEKGTGYLLTPDGTVTQVLSGLGYANGLQVTEDNRLLIADTANNVILAYTLGADGLPTGHTVWATMSHPDSMVLDRLGRLWVASVFSGAVYVFDPGGKQMRRFTVPRDATDNVAFGPPESGLVFITSSAPPSGCVNVLRIDPHDELAAGLP